MKNKLLDRAAEKLFGDGIYGTPWFVYIHLPSFGVEDVYLTSFGVYTIKQLNDALAKK